MNFIITFACFIAVFLLSHGANIEIDTQERLEIDHGIMKELETNFFKGASDLAAQIFQNHLKLPPDSKKEIEIHCPGPDPPQVFVRELARDDEELEETMDLDGEEDGQKEENVSKSSKCLSIKLTGTNFEMNMKVNC